MLGLGRRQRCRRYRDLSLENFQALFFSRLGRERTARAFSATER